MPLKTIKGMDTRPTTDKTKETLFNVLQTDIPDCRFLDLFSGSGAIAIEALSRGAAHAVLVEQNAKAAECIKENLIFTKTMERAEIQKCDVLTALHRMEGQKPFDVSSWIRLMIRGWKSRCWNILFTARWQMIYGNRGRGISGYGFFLSGRSWISHI